MFTEQIIIQGEPGCFHEEAAIKYRGGADCAFIPAESFVQLAHLLDERPKERSAIMAIENSIAGSILQNYRILREHNFKVIGEVYLRIEHNLMALPGQHLRDLTEVHSHPMALNQCLDYLFDKNLKVVEAEDTALSAKRISEGRLQGIAAIAGRRAAEIYGLEIIAAGIETSKVNYTRFFMIEAAEVAKNDSDGDKASIYLRVSDGAGRLLKVLEAVSHFGISLTKLQSYPVLGEMKRYYFHLDLEFEAFSDFKKCMKSLENCTDTLEVLGTYKRARSYD